MQYVASHLQEQELFMLTALADVPRCITQDRGWSVEKMRGIYEYDATAPLADTLPPWQVEALIDRHLIDRRHREVRGRGKLVGFGHCRDAYQ